MNTVYVLIAIFLAFAPPTSHGAETFDLVDHTTMSCAGTVRSQGDGHHHATGTMTLDAGTVSLSIIVTAGNYVDNITATGTYEVSDTGSLVHVSYTSGIKHTGVAIPSCSGCLTTLACDHKVCEVNVWKPQHAFVRNQ